MLFAKDYYAFFYGVVVATPLIVRGVQGGFYNADLKEGNKERKNKAGSISFMFFYYVLCNVAVCR